MSAVDDRLEQLGLTLPAPPKLPPGVEIPFEWARRRGRSVYVSGHGALAADGSPQGPFGRVPSEVSLEEAQQSARLATLAMLASVKAAIGDFDNVAGWLMINGFVNADPGYPQTTLVLNPCSELILDLFGPEVGGHARWAMGVVAIPLNLPVTIAAQLEIHPQG